MSLGHGGKIVKSGLIFNADSYDFKCNFLTKSSSNILNDPYYWNTGTGSVSGYGRNGDEAEQNRAERADPFGGRTVTWRSQPDATSGADGGWNSSYYPIDRSYRYRYSVYVKRYTSGTGGTFYMGTNPAPLRNDNNGLQGNPYFTYPSIASLTQDQWYLVVGNCHPEDYTGGRHPDSGWYEIKSDGKVHKIPDKSYGNLGAQDVRWPSSTTTSMHRTYHYYTTNTASGIEWAYPRVDKCDGTEPTIHQLVQRGPGKFYNSLDPGNGSIRYGRPDFGTIGGAEAWKFDATNELFDDGPVLRSPNTEASLEAWIYPAATEVSSGDRGTIIRVHGSSGATYLSWNKSTRRISSYWHGTSPAGYHEPGPALNREQWYHVVVVWDGTNHYHYINGVQYGPVAVTGAGTVNTTMEIGMESTGRQFAGGISVIRAYDVALSPTDVKQNFEATRARYGR